MPAEKKKEVRPHRMEKGRAMIISKKERNPQPSAARSKKRSRIGGDAVERKKEKSSNESPLWRKEERLGLPF